MGGMQWSGDEEAYFWKVLIPKSPKAIEPDDRKHKWDVLAEMMINEFAPNPRRKYNATMLFEHWFQNYVTNKISPKAAFYVAKYTREVANWLAENPEQQHKVVSKKEPHGSTTAARRRAGAFRTASAPTTMLRAETFALNTPVITTSPQAVASQTESTSASPRTSSSTMSTTFRTSNPARAGRINGGRFRERFYSAAVLSHRSMSPRLDFSNDGGAQQPTAGHFTGAADWNHEDVDFQGKHLQSPRGQFTQPVAFTPQHECYANSPTNNQYRWDHWNSAGFPQHSHAAPRSFSYQNGDHLPLQHSMMAQADERPNEITADQTGRMDTLPLRLSCTGDLQEQSPESPYYQENSTTQGAHEEASWDRSASLDRLATLVAAAEQCSHLDMAPLDHPCEAAKNGHRDTAFYENSVTPQIGVGSGVPDLEAPTPTVGTLSASLGQDAF